MLRAHLPITLARKQIHFAWRLLDHEGEHLLTSSIREGVWLSVDQLRLVCAKSALDTSGNKIDLATRLVDHMFPTASVDEKKRMVACLMWRSPQKLTEEEKEILKYVGELDEENRECPEFKKVAKLAKQQLQSKTEAKARQQGEEKARREFEEKQLSEEQKRKEAEKAAKAALEESQRKKPNSDPAPSADPPARSRKSSQTPKELKDFLTAGMINEKISLNRDKAGYGYRAFYPSTLLSYSEPCDLKNKKTSGLVFFLFLASKVKRPLCRRTFSENGGLPKLAMK